MLKYSLIFCFFCFCSSKVEVLSFKEQLEYSGIEGGTTYVNYQVELENPKEESIQIVGVWVKGKWLKYSPTEASSKIIQIYVSDVYNNPAVDSVPAPSGNNSHNGVIRYQITGKKKIKYCGIGSIERLEPLSRP